MGQESVACIAAMRSSRLSGCFTTELPFPTRENDSGAIQRHVSQSMHVWSTKNCPPTLPSRGSF